MILTQMPAIVADGFAVLILLVLLISVKRRQTRFMPHDQQLFVWMLETNLLLLVLDAGTMILNGRVFPGARTLNLICTAGYYAADPMMAYLYIRYCDIKMGVPYEKRRQLRWLYRSPLIINLLLTILSIWYPIMFRLSEQNVYSRAPFLVFSFVLSTILLPVALVKVTLYLLRLHRQNRKDPGAASPNALISLFLFPIIPLLGTLTQIWFNQITVVWLSTVIALLIIFIGIQNLEIATDGLTGLFNRRQADSYLQNIFLPSSHTQTFCVLMMDMDHFKLINDHHGHIIGDSALRALAQVLRAECEPDEFIGRYGGDEFIIITTHSDPERLDDLIRRINYKLAYYGNSRQLNYPLSISVGYARRTPETLTADQLIAHADEALYQQKARLRRRVSDR